MSCPTSGSLIAFGTNGTFTYRPNTGFSGIDSFTYKVNDGSLDSNVAKVTIAVGTKLLAQQNLESNVGINSQLTTGNLYLTEQITPDQSIVNRDNSLAKPIITVETQLAPGVSVPSAITAQLTFNGTAGTTYSYTTSSTGRRSSHRYRRTQQHLEIPNRSLRSDHRIHNCPRIHLDRKSQHGRFANRSE